MHFPKTIEAGLLKVGHLIVDRVNPKTGAVTASHPVKTLDWRRGCAGVHVNGRECWEGLVQIVNTEVSA